jgi:endonuclease/exonuclease/phosphatase family metal-dependent hydrolase
MTRLIVYNIEYCEGIRGHWYEYLKLWRNFRAPKQIDSQIVSSLRDLTPDFLALVEVDTGSFRARKHNEVNFFRDSLDMFSCAQEIKYPNKSWLKLFRKVPILKFQANAIMGDRELHDIKTHYFSCGTKRVIIETTIYLPQKTTFLLVHLALGQKTRAKQLKELINLVNSFKGPLILMGDFNTFKGLIEIEELLSKTNLVVPTKNSSDPTLTQPAFKPSRVLDYILTSPQINVNNYEVLNFEYSDHRPLLIDFEVES